MAGKSRSRGRAGPIGINLRYFREKAKLSQEQLAVNAGVSRGTIANLERGSSHQPNTRKLSAIAKALNVELGDLVEARLAVTPVEPQLQQFIESDYGKDLKLTEEERTWLRSVPATYWIDCPPSNQTLQYMVLAHRARVKKK